MCDFAHQEGVYEASLTIERAVAMNIKSVIVSAKYSIFFSFSV